jgi:hypothetical protein
MEEDKSDGTGCPECGVAYSFFYRMQFHKKNCSLAQGVKNEI